MNKNCDHFLTKHYSIMSQFCNGSLNFLIDILLNFNNMFAILLCMYYEYLSNKLLVKLTLLFCNTSTNLFATI
jgi:hypothetical protein